MGRAFSKPMRSYFQTHSLRLRCGKIPLIYLRRYDFANRFLLQVSAYKFGCKQCQRTAKRPLLKLINKSSVTPFVPHFVGFFLSPERNPAASDYREKRKRQAFTFQNTVAPGNIKQISLLSREAVTTKSPFFSPASVLITKPLN